MISIKGMGKCQKQDFPNSINHFYEPLSYKGMMISFGYKSCNAMIHGRCDGDPHLIFRKNEIIW